MSASLLDFSKPGEEGVLPDGFTRWRWSVAYTVHPKFHAPVKYGEEHRIIVSVLRRITSAEDPGFAGLYNLAAKIARARASHLKCNDTGTFLYTRIRAQGWFMHGDTNLARAAVTIGAMYLRKGDTLPEGQAVPAAEAFAGPSTMMPALSPEELNTRVYEVYADGDIRDPAAANMNIFGMSYGVYVPSAAEVDYAPLVERAEELARFHLSMTPASNVDTSQIIRREWFCATNPDIAVIHLYIQT